MYTFGGTNRQFVKLHIAAILWVESQVDKKSRSYTYFCHSSYSAFFHWLEIWAQTARPISPIYKSIKFWTILGEIRKRWIPNTHIYSVCRSSYQTNVSVKDTWNIVYVLVHWKNVHSRFGNKVNMNEGISEKRERENRTKYYTWIILPHKFYVQEIRLLNFLIHTTLHLYRNIACTTWIEWVLMVSPAKHHGDNNLTRTYV